MRQSAGPSQLAPAAVQSVRPSSWCPLCKLSCGEMMPVSISYYTVRVCLPCGKPIAEAIDGAGAVARFLAKFF